MRHPRRRTALALLLPAGAVLLAACGSGDNNQQNSLKPAGPAAEKIDNLFLPILTVAIVIGVLVLAGTVYAAIRFRHREGRPDNPKQVHGNTPLEIGWTIVPALILAVVAVPTVATIWDLAETPKGPDVLKVRAIGQQWWWSFEIGNQPLAPDIPKKKSGDDQSGPVYTSTELHIPVGTKVDISLQSMDVIHSFWVPELAGKKDVMPGRTNRLTIEADEPGTYLGACAEYCGLAHADMRFRVVAQTMDDWKAWLADISGPPAQPWEGTVKELTGTKYGCTNCHVFDNAHQNPYGPNLTHLASRTTFAGGTLEVNRKNLTDWILDAPSLVPMESKDCRLPPPATCRGMPSFIKNTPKGQPVMTSEDAATIVDYLLGEK